jgi:hypothetical protein
MQQPALHHLFCFRLHHPQTQCKSTILNSSSDSHKKALFMGGTISHATGTELETRNILHSTEKLLSKVEERRHKTKLHSQLTKK